MKVIMFLMLAALFVGCPDTSKDSVEDTNAEVDASTVEDVGGTEDADSEGDAAGDAAEDVSTDAGEGVTGAASDAQSEDG